MPPDAENSSGWISSNDGAAVTAAAASARISGRAITAAVYSVLSASSGAIRIARRAGM